ncbi:hypothetical protein AB4144_50945, partial [Rhizobiaceae sp. 2RAB30]
HSGSIRNDLRSRFEERTPSAGGDEKTWIRQYVDVRHDWLTHHSNPEVRPSNYRTRDLAREIARGNWDLDMMPFMANGVPVRDVVVSPGGVAPAMDLVPYRGDETVDGFEVGEGEVWSEVELPAYALAAFGVADVARGLAARILGHGGITLA